MPDWLVDAWRPIHCVHHTFGSAEMTHKIRAGILSCGVSAKTWTKIVTREGDVDVLFQIEVVWEWIVLAGTHHFVHDLVGLLSPVRAPLEPGACELSFRCSLLRLAVVPESASRPLAFRCSFLSSGVMVTSSLTGASFPGEGLRAPLEFAPHTGQMVRRHE